MCGSIQVKEVKLSDIAKFRLAFKQAGFRQRDATVPKVYNDLNKASGLRRIKLDEGDHIFSAPRFAQEDLEHQFKEQFGDRYLFGEFIAGHPRDGGKSLVIFLIE